MRDHSPAYRSRFKENGDTCKCTEQFLFSFSQVFFQKKMWLYEKENCNLLPHRKFKQWKILFYRHREFLFFRGIIDYRLRFERMRGEIQFVEKFYRRRKFLEYPKKVWGMHLGAGRKLPWKSSNLFKGPKVRRKLILQVSLWPPLFFRTRRKRILSAVLSLSLSLVKQI